MSINKICVYAICKDEINFVDKWLNSMNEADYIVVLDTGSTDGTYEKLKSDPRVTRVEQKPIIPWRFDVARNESMKLIPEDANICVCTDFDELFDPGWAQVLRSKWDDSKHYSAGYRYAWGCSNTGAPIKTFWYDKIHARNGFKWKFPVHEIIMPENEKLDTSRQLNLFQDNVFLHHYPDLSRSRNYLNLLELRAKENPTELMTLIHITHEYLYNKNYEECISLCKQIEHHVLNDLAPDSDLNINELLCANCLFEGDSYVGLGKYDDAIKIYLDAIHHSPIFMEPYIALAQVYVLQKDYKNAIQIIEQATQNGTKYFTWFVRNSSKCDAQLYELLSFIYIQLGDDDKAFINIYKANVLDPFNKIFIKTKALLSQKINKSLNPRELNSIDADKVLKL